MFMNILVSKVVIDSPYVKDEIDIFIVYTISQCYTSRVDWKYVAMDITLKVWILKGVLEQIPPVKVQARYIVSDPGQKWTRGGLKLNTCCNMRPAGAAHSPAHRGGLFVLTQRKEVYENDKGQDSQ